MRDFHIFDRSFMKTPHIVFRVETRNFFSPKKLHITYKLTFQNSIYTDNNHNNSVVYQLNIDRFHCRNDNKIKHNEVIS